MKFPVGFVLLVCFFRDKSLAFAPPRSATPAKISSSRSPSTTSSSASSSPTALHWGVMIDLPDGFFTVTMIGSGLMLGIAKNFGRMRMEERAWEQRLEEGRKRRLAEDPTLTELDLRRREAELEWSAYGKSVFAEEENERRGGGKRRRVKVMERTAGGGRGDDDEYDYRSNRMSDREIDQFETEFGIDYDPYYDDPYTEDELPEGEFKVDKKYGDRFYQDGEIFYKDAQTGLYYRQGARPRSISFFSP